MLTAVDDTSEMDPAPVKPFDAYASLRKQLCRLEGFVEGLDTSYSKHSGRQAFALECLGECRRLVNVLQNPPAKNEIEKRLRVLKAVQNGETQKDGDDE